MMKKIAVLLFITMLFVLTACSETQQPVSYGPDEVTNYTLADTGGDSNSWFYQKYNIESSTIDGEWFDSLDSKMVSEWVEQYEKEKKAGNLDTTYPPLVKFIKDCNIPQETCRKIMIKIKANEENQGIRPQIHLTEEEIQVIYSWDKKKINEAFVSEYCILANGEIYTPEWLLNHPVSEYKNKGITHEQLNEKVESKYANMLGENHEFIEIYKSKLQQLKKQ
jgi:hypothetical protein